MEHQNFIENGFIIDLSNAKDTLSVISELSNILDMTESKEKNICLKLRDVELSQSQLLSIKALINASGSTLAFIDTNVQKTIDSATDLGIKISTLNNNFTVEKNDKKEEVQEEKTETSNNAANSENNSEDKSGNLEDENTPIIESNDSNYLIAEIPANLFPEQELQEEIVEVNDSYEVFKTEEMEEEKNHELPTLYLKQTLRSGQTLSYDGNILVIGDTHPGSELIAKGDITVWGVLAGIAHAGTSGDKNARIRALKLDAIQLRIAGIYAGRLNTENIPYIQRTNEFTPQEAKIKNDTIVITSINSNI